MKVFVLSARYFCYILMKVEFSRQIYENHSNIKFHENRSSRCRILTDGRADGQSDKRTETNSRISQFCIHVRNYSLPRKSKEY